MGDDMGGKGGMVAGIVQYGRWQGGGMSDDMDDMSGMEVAWRWHGGGMGAT